MERRLEDLAPAFDAPALVAALRERHPNRPIRFTSHDSRATQPTVVRKVEIEKDHILVALNIGTRSATSPLPSYFLELCADARVGPALAEILDIADHRLLSDRVDALAPEASPRLLPRARAVREDALALARPASLTTLHWIFRSVYPELGVSVRRAPVRRGLPMEEMRLGSARLGDAVFGDEAEVMVPGMEVVLSTEDSDTWAGPPWLAEAPQRLRHKVFPVLGRTAAHLRVLLVDHESRSPLELLRPSQLGLDPLVVARPPRVSLIFEGRVPISKVSRKVGSSKADV